MCTVGDALLDVVVRLDGPVALDTDTYGTSRVSAGGQAANVAAWVSTLGGGGRLVGKRARDAAGRVVASELQARGVEVCGPIAETGTGTVVSIVTPDGRRTMLSDRGVATELRPEELDGAWFGDCDWLHVPGYSLVREPLATAAGRAAAAAARVSVDASSTAAIAELGAERFRAAVEALEPVLLFANEDEEALVRDVSVDTLVVKQGARGCVVRQGTDERAYDAVPAAVVDTTGAGDAFAAGFLLAGPGLALEAAARCVARMGAMP